MDDPLAELSAEERRALAEIAQARVNGTISRRDALKLAGMGGIGALMGGGGMAAATEPASAGTNQSGTIGSSANPVDIEAEDVNAVSVNAENLSNDVYFASEYDGGVGYDKIQNAIADAPAGARVRVSGAGPDDGGVWFTNGTALSAPSNIQLDFRGASIQKDTSQGEHGFLKNADQTNGNSNITVIGGDWDGGRTAEQSVSDYGFHFYNADNVTVRDVNIYNCGFFGVVVSAVTDSRFEDVSFWPDTPKDGLKLMGPCENIRIKNLQGATYDNLLSICPDDYQTNLDAYGEAGNIRDVRVEDVHIEQPAADEPSEIRIVGSSTVEASEIVIEGVHYKAHPDTTGNGNALNILDENPSLMSGDGLVKAVGLTLREFTTRQNGGTRLLDIGGDDVSTVDVEDVTIAADCTLAQAVNIDGGKDLMEIEGIRQLGDAQPVFVSSGTTGLTELRVSDIYQTSNDPMMNLNTGVTDVHIEDIGQYGPNNMLVGSPDTDTNVHISDAVMDYGTTDDYSLVTLTSEVNSIEVSGAEIRTGRVVKNYIQGAEDWTLRDVVVSSGKRIADISSAATDATLTLDNVVYKASNLEPFYIDGATIKFLGGAWRNETTDPDFSLANSPTVAVDNPNIVTDVGNLTPDTYDKVTQEGATLKNGLAQYDGTNWVSLLDGTTA